MQARFVLIVVALATCATVSSAEERLRMIVETDAGGDPDDEQSLVRFLLYTNEWDVEGIIANRPKARDGENKNTERTGLGICRRLVKAYGECFGRLREHDERFPKPELLLARTVPGDNDTEDGVNLILRAVDADDPRPVWFMNWGTDLGAAVSCLKRALDRVLKERGPEGYAKFKKRLRLSSDEQFGEHTTRLEPPFPLWVDTFRPELERKRWYHRFSGITAKAGGFDLERDVRTNHGPLGALYPTNTTHVQKEGDTMTFLYLVPNGLGDPEQPTWGSWAGRYGRNEKFAEKPYYHANVRDEWNGTTHRENTLARFAADLQNDFRARLDWCVKPRGEANHPPRVKLAGETSRRAKVGETVTLDISGTTDPDGDELAIEWWLYREPSEYAGRLDIQDAAPTRAKFTVPNEARGKELHLVATVRDSGEPPLARYARVRVAVE
jgi:hypothetical protein